jgi:polyphosphate glucokinase
MHFSIICSLISNMKKNPPPQRILSIDIGGSGIKASLIDQEGQFIVDYKKVNTPFPADPENVLKAIRSLVKDFPEYDVVSAGFPGYVRDGIVHTAPNLDNEAWKLTDLNDELSKALGKPARVVNDADLQGLGIAHGKGLEMVMTLGTGFGTALLKDGVLLPHLELSHLPVTKKKDYDAYIGNMALSQIGEKKWNKRMERVLHTFKTVINFDALYISGGNAKKLTFPLDDNVKIVSNREGIKGGVRLWK